MLAILGASSCWREVGWMAPSGSRTLVAEVPVDPVAANSSRQAPVSAMGVSVRRRRLSIRDIRQAAPVGTGRWTSLTALVFRGQSWNSRSVDSCRRQRRRETIDRIVGHYHGLGRRHGGFTGHDRRRVRSVAGIFGPAGRRAGAAVEGIGLVLVTGRGLGGQSCRRTEERAVATAGAVPAGGDSGFARLALLARLKSFS